MDRPRGVEPGECRSCKAPIYWVRTLRRAGLPEPFCFMPKRQAAQEVSLNALTQTTPRAQIGPAIGDAGYSSRELLSVGFMKLAEQYDALAKASVRRGKALLREQAALARKHAYRVLFEKAPSVVYVSRVGATKLFVFWQPGGNTLCRPATWLRTNERAKIWIGAENLRGKEVHKLPIRFDPPGGL